MAAPMAAADTAVPPPPVPPAAEPAAKVSPAPSDMAPTAAATDAAAPTPPAAAPPTAATDTAAPPPPPPVTEPAVHMAAPPVAAESAARPPAPPPPPPEIAAKVPYPFPHFPPQPDAPAPKKRKLEEAGFHTSAYYKIRATVADLRLRFIQVHEATDFRKSDAAREILREIKIVMELSKRMRLDLSPSSEPVKPSEKPLAGAMKDGPTEPIPSGETNQVPQTVEKITEEIQASEMASHPKHLVKNVQGSYVIGGSPIGWNFLVWPGSKILPPVHSIRRKRKYDFASELKARATLGFSIAL